MSIVLKQLGEIADTVKFLITKSVTRIELTVGVDNIDLYYNESIPFTLEDSLPIFSIGRSYVEQASGNTVMEIMINKPKKVPFEIRSSNNMAVGIPGVWITTYFPTALGNHELAVLLEGMNIYFEILSRKNPKISMRFGTEEY